MSTLPMHLANPTPRALAWTFFDEYGYTNNEITSWASFSADAERTKRYRLTWSLDGSPLQIDEQKMLRDHVAFLLLNPSTAGARHTVDPKRLKDDPTVRECAGFAKRWGATAFEVVNLFALRSTHPEVLYTRQKGERGADEQNDDAIGRACAHARLVIAAWGNHGELDGRSEQVLARLVNQGRTLHCLAFTKSGAPRHPIARGKHRIPRDVVPRVYAAPFPAGAAP